jgi:uncharacterized membrane protein YraQ (UPF0718 family)
MDLSQALLAMWRVFADAAIEIVPFFLLAILIGAWIEEYASERTITRFLTGRRPATMLLASTTGAVIPLCTCGMVPLAVSLRRRGSDIKHTFAFLTAGASVSVPVLFLTWKVLGWPWALVRFGVSVLFGLAVGYAAVGALRSVAARSALPGEAERRHGDHTHGPATATRPGPTPPAPESEDFGISEIRGSSRFSSVLRRFKGQILEYGPWVLVSLVVAAVVDVLVPRHWVDLLYGERTGAGTLLAALSGLPFYFCSGAELPLVRELLSKGMGPGPATAMLLSVPIVNLLTFGVVSRWIGSKGALVYLSLCVLGATLLGVVTGWIWSAVAPL